MAQNAEIPSAEYPADMHRILLAVLGLVLASCVKNAKQTPRTKDSSACASNQFRAMFCHSPGLNLMLATSAMHALLVQDCATLTLARGQGSCIGSIMSGVCAGDHRSSLHGHLLRARAEQG